MTRTPFSGIAFALLCLVLLGTMPILSNARPEGSNELNFAIWTTLWQLVAALPLFMVELATRKPAAAPRQRPAGPKARIAAIALVTGAMFGLSTYMYVVAAEKAGPISMVIALQAYPFLAMIWEALFFGKRKTKREIGFTLVMVAALVYLVTGGTLRVSEISGWSVFALGIPLLWSIAHILLKQVLDTTSVTPNQVTVSRLLISGTCLLVLQATLDESGLLLTALSAPGFQRAAVILGVAYYLELIFWFHAVRHIDVSVASSVTVPAPAVTLLIAVAVLGDEVRVYQVVSMGVIALSLYGLLLAGRRTPPK